MKTTDIKTETEEAKTSTMASSKVLEVVGAVGAKLGHDFNNLFAAIQGCSELMKMKLGKLPSGNPCERQIQIIEASIAKGIIITNQMRGWVRNEAIPLKSMALEPILNSVVEFLNSSRVVKADVELVILAKPSAPTSEFHVRQALISLCANAIDAMHDQADRVLVLMLDEGKDKDARDFARITVIDHGVGISADRRESLLQPLHGLENQNVKSHRVGEGLGINLAMVHELMGRLGGELTIRSAPGIGSAFSLVFPRSN